MPWATGVPPIPKALAIPAPLAAAGLIVEPNIGVSRIIAKFGAFLRTHRPFPSCCAIWSFPPASSRHDVEANELRR